MGAYRRPEQRHLVRRRVPGARRPRFHRRARAWASAHRTPPLYPDAVTLTPEASAAELLPRVDTRSPGCSVKDSFARLNLASAGFEVLFEAQWIHRPAGATAPAPMADVRWDVVRDDNDLAAWAAAWSGEPAGSGRGDTAQRRPDNGPFRSELLADDGTLFLRGRRGDTVVAGAVASPEGPVVGLSNVFAADGDPRGAWAGVLATVAARWAGRRSSDTNRAPTWRPRSATAACPSARCGCGGGPAERRRRGGSAAGQRCGRPGRAAGRTTPQVTAPASSAPPSTVVPALTPEPPPRPVCEPPLGTGVPRLGGDRHGPGERQPPVAVRLARLAAGLSVPGSPPGSVTGIGTGLLPGR